MQTNHNKFRLPEQYNKLIGDKPDTSDTVSREWSMILPLTPKALVIIDLHMESMDINGNSFIEPTVKDVINYQFYSMLKPTLFVLRFFGGPTGLWRFKKCNASPGQYRKVCAVLMLLMYNLGAISNLYFNVNAMIRSKSSFRQNIKSLYVLAISTCGTLCLDILWLKRNKLRQLLREIDFEPKCCPIIDQEVRGKNEKEIRVKTIKLSIAMVLFVAYVNYVYFTLVLGDKNRVTSAIENRLIILIYIFNFMSIYPFTMILSFYISLSWIFRLKVYRVIRYLRENLDDQCRNRTIPNPSHVEMIQVWFSAYVVQFKTYNLIFKQIAGWIYLVLVWSVMALGEQTLSNVMAKNVLDWDKNCFVHEILSAIVLLQFLYWVSTVDYILKKFIKLLYRQALVFKFGQTDVSQCLSEKVLIVWNIPIKVVKSVI